MGAAAVPVALPEPFQVQSSQPGPDSAITPSDNGITDNKKRTSMLNTLSTIIIVIGVPTNGFAAIGILSGAIRSHAAEMSPDENSNFDYFIKFWIETQTSTLLLAFLGIAGLEWMWLIGSGIMCPLIFAGRFAHTSNHFLVFRALLGNLVAVMRVTSQRFEYAEDLSGTCYFWLVELAEQFCPLWAGVLCFGLSEVSSWQWSLFTIATIGGLLFASSIIVLPAVQTSPGVPGLEWLRPYFTKYWLIHICLSAALYLSFEVSREAFYRLWIFMFESSGYISPLHAETLCYIIVPATWAGSMIFMFIAFHITASILMELEYTFNLPLEFSSASSGKDGNDGAESAYTACSLVTPDSIRVIHLHPGSPKDNLRCTLKVVRLGEQPSFDALSYCWGQHVTKRYITIRPFPALAAAQDDIEPSESLAITDTLHDALIYLRYPNTERILWVDQICIDQSNETERSAQVKLMQEIYSSTRCAIVWLRVGRPELPVYHDAEKSDLAEFFEELETAIVKISNDNGLEGNLAVAPENYKVQSIRPLRHMANHAKYGLPNESDQRWALFYGLFDAPWFNRVWIVQEVAWPSVVKVHYTNLEKSWDQFIRVINFVESLDIKTFSPRCRAISRFFQRLRALQECRRNTQASKFESLDKVLAQHRMAAASDPRDHIYGLMGLASQRPCLEPDYEASTRHVFLETAKWAMREGRLDILGLCGEPSNPSHRLGLPRPKRLPLTDDTSCKKDLRPMPSWVPDFSDTDLPHSLTGMGMLLPNEFTSMARFNAGGSCADAPRVREDGVMEILGQPIGELQELSAGAAPARTTVDMHILQRSTQIEAARLHRGDIIRESLRIMNTNLAWDQMARQLAAKGSKYEYTGESLEDALLSTCLLGETGETLEKLRSPYRDERFKIKIWELLTLGQGCSSQFMGYVIMMVMSLVLRTTEPVLRRYGYNACLNSGEYNARRQLSIERRLFCGRNGLIGLAPRWARSGDEIFIPWGGKVPLILRRTTKDGPYQFIGEAYVHGAMHGENFDLQKCEKILIV